MMMEMRRGYRRLREEREEDEEPLLTVKKKEVEEKRKNRRPGLIRRIRSAVADIFDAPPSAAASATASAAAVALSVSVAVLAANGAGGGGGGSGRAVRGLQNENFIEPDVPTGILVDLPTNAPNMLRSPSPPRRRSSPESPIEAHRGPPAEVPPVPTEVLIEASPPSPPSRCSSRPPPSFSSRSPPLKFPPTSPPMCSLRSPSPSRCPSRPPPSSPPRRLSSSPSRSPLTTPSRLPSPLDSPPTTDLLPSDVGQRRLSAWPKSGQRKTGCRISTGRLLPWRLKSMRPPDNNEDADERVVCTANTFCTKYWQYHHTLVQI